MSKNNTNRENQVILLRNTDRKTWHYLALKIFPALFRGVTSKFYGDFQCINYLHSYIAEKILKSIIMHVKIMIIFCRNAQRR